MLGLRHYKGTAIDLFVGDINDFVSDVTIKGTAATPETSTEPSLVRLLRPAGKDILLVLDSIEEHDTSQAQRKLKALYQSCWEHLQDSQKPLHVTSSVLGYGRSHLSPQELAEGGIQSVRNLLDSDLSRYVRRFTFVLEQRDMYQFFQHALFLMFPEE